MKWIILTFLIFLLVVLAVNRYRKQINGAIRFWKMLQNDLPQEKVAEKKIVEKEDKKEFQLIKCSACGTWIPQNNAINLNSKIYVCTADCMEKAVKVKL